MMDDIFWNMGFRNADSGQGCYFFITIIFVYSNYFDYLYRFDLPWALLTMTGKNVARKLQTQSIHWAKITVLHFILDGWLTSRKYMVLPVPYSQGRLNATQTKWL